MLKLGKQVIFGIKLTYFNFSLNLFSKLYLIAGINDEWVRDTVLVLIFF